MQLLITGNCKNIKPTFLVSGIMSPLLLTVMAVANALIAISYLAIAFFLIVYIRKGKDMPFSRVIFLFGLFILAFGISQVLQVIGFWWTVNWGQAIVDSICAVISLVTAFVVWLFLPKLLSIPSPIQLKLFDNELQNEKDKLLHTQRELQKSYDEIEQRVKERTAELQIANETLSEVISERKKAEEAGRLSEELFRNVFENSFVGKSISSMDGKQKTNMAFCQTLGYSEEELSLIKWQEITYPDDLIRDQNILDSILSGEYTSKHWEKRYIHKDRHTVWVDISTVLQRDHDGKPLYFITTIFDINERKLSEEALYESQKLLQEITDNSTSHIFALDLESRFLLVNRSLEYVFGVKRETIIGKTREAFLPPSIAATHRLNDLKVMKERHSITIEEENMEKDGIHTYISVKFPLLDTHGTLLGVGGVSSDITKQKKNEVALRESERFLRESQEVAHLGSFVFYLSIGVWTSSKILDEIFGINEDYIRSFEGWSHIVHPDWREIMVNYLTNDVLGKHLRFDKEYQIIRQDDAQVRWLHGQAVLEFDSKNQPLKLIGTIIDITERKQAEKAILTLNAELEQRVVDRTIQLENANKELEAFSYSISHDLRAPLRHISGFISLFLKNKESHLSEEELGYLNIVTNSSDEMGKLIDALLTFSRLSKTELQKTQNDTLQIIQQGLNLYEEEIESRGIEIKIGLLYETYGDYQLIGQVWANLIANAIKYTGKKKKALIEISSFIEDNSTIFLIKDNGAGFNMKYADKLFGVFQRLHKARDFEGVGIGLANVNRIINRHGGNCWAEGEIDKGATFYFSLPNK